MDPILERYHALEKKVAAYTPNLDPKLLYEAFTYADTEHHTVPYASTVSCCRRGMRTSTLAPVLAL